MQHTLSSIHRSNGQLIVTLISNDVRLIGEPNESDYCFITSTGQVMIYYNRQQVQMIEDLDGTLFDQFTIVNINDRMYCCYLIDNTLKIVDIVRDKSGTMYTNSSPRDIIVPRGCMNKVIRITTKLNKETNSQLQVYLEGNYVSKIIIFPDTAKVIELAVDAVDLTRSRFKYSLFYVTPSGELRFSSNYWHLSSILVNQNIVAVSTLEHISLFLRRDGSLFCGKIEETDRVSVSEIINVFPNDVAGICGDKCVVNGEVWLVQDPSVTILEKLVMINTHCSASRIGWNGELILST
jgi:hypothetical protein